MRSGRVCRGSREFVHVSTFCLLAADVDACTRRAGLGLAGTRPVSGNHDPGPSHADRRARSACRVHDIPWKVVRPVGSGKALILGYRRAQASCCSIRRTGNPFPCCVDLGDRHPIDLIVARCRDQDETTSASANHHVMGREHWDKELNRAYAVRAGRRRWTRSIARLSNLATAVVEVPRRGACGARPYLRSQRHDVADRLRATTHGADPGAGAANGILYSEW